MWCMGLVAPWHVESSWTRDWTHASCIGRQILIHWATREVLFLLLLHQLHLRSSGIISQRLVTPDLIADSPLFSSLRCSEVHTGSTRKTHVFSAQSRHRLDQGWQHPVGVSIWSQRRLNSDPAFSPHELCDQMHFPEPRFSRLYNGDKSLSHGLRVCWYAWCTSHIAVGWLLFLEWHDMIQWCKSSSLP